MSPGNLLGSALHGVFGNPLRALLTVLGLVIGAGSVICMLALGNGARAAVDSSFRFLGSDSVEISARQKMKQGEFVPVGKILSYQDGLTLPGATELVRSVEMRVNAAGKARFGRVSIDLGLAGTTANALESLAGSGELQPLRWPKDKPLGCRRARCTRTHVYAA